MYNNRETHNTKSFVTCRLMPPYYVSKFRGNAYCQAQAWAIKRVMKYDHLKYTILIVNTVFTKQLKPKMYNMVSMLLFKTKKIHISPAAATTSVTIIC